MASVEGVDAVAETAECSVDVAQTSIERGDDSL